MMSYRKLLIISHFFIFFGLFLPKCIYGASVTTSVNTNALQNDQELTVSVGITINASDGTNYYLRGVFAKNGSTNYCGYTWNGNSWYSGPYSSGSNGWKNFLPITIQNNSWNGEMKAKIDSGDSGCKDSGTYTFKIERFTESGSGSFDTQNDQTVSLVIPTATPSPAPTVTPTRVPTPTSIPKVPTPTKTILIQTVQNTPTKTISTSFLPEASEGAVLGDHTASSAGSQDEELVAGDTFLPSPTPASIQVSKNSPQAFIFLLVGASFLISCGILLFLKLKKEGKL